MKIYICPNLFTSEQREQAADAIRVLEEKGHQCALSPSDAFSLFSDPSHAGFNRKEADLIVTIGGDGAVLRGAQKALQAGVPLFGINSGRLGYLCALNIGEIDRFDEVCRECLHTRRSLLEFTIDGQTRYALNDVVFAKKDFGTSVDLTVATDENDVFKIRGDGLIISTPTGSTAYNLSARGPILDTNAPVYALTPINAHASLAHSVVLSEKKTITVSERNGDAVIYADGVESGIPKAPIEVRVSDKTVILMSRNRPLNDIARLG